MPSIRLCTNPVQKETFRSLFFAESSSLSLRPVQLGCLGSCSSIIFRIDRSIGLSARALKLHDDAYASGSMISSIADMVGIQSMFYVNYF